MKLIIAVIRPEKLQAVEGALREHDVCLMSTGQVLADAREPGPIEIYRGRSVRTRPTKLRLELAVEDEAVEAAVWAIRRAATTGDAAPLGDGMVFVLPVDASVRICDGERRSAAVAASNGKSRLPVMVN
jgi:nitrogen regulatory protein P-II 2